MVINKACFSVLLGLDVMKPLGTVIDLLKDQLSFTEPGGQQRIQIPLTCTRNRKTLEDVKTVTTVHQVRMLRPVPAHQGPIVGQSIFPGLDQLSPEARRITDEFRTTAIRKTSNRAKKRIQLKSKPPKADRPFPEGANINPDLTPEQRQ